VTEVPGRSYYHAGNAFQRAGEGLVKVELALLPPASDLEELLRCLGDARTFVRVLWQQLGPLLALPLEVPRSLHHAPITPDLLCSKHQHVGLFSFTMTSQIFIDFLSFLSASFSQPIGTS